VEGVMGLKAAVQYLKNVGMDYIREYEDGLLKHANDTLSAVDGIRFFGTAPEKASVVSFLIGSIHPFDTGTIIDKMGIAVRTGHHCAQPLIDHYGIPGTVRASFAFYNTADEIDRLAEAVRRVKTMFS